MWFKQCQQSEVNTLSAAATLVALAIPSLSLASTGDMSCKIVGVTDGDTMTALCPGNKEAKIRLAQIDAPEKKQPFGHRSKRRLADLCFGELASIHQVATDKYGRTVADVTCRRHDAARSLVHDGLAWVYDKYVIDHSLYEDQDQARKNWRGLWLDPDPVPPWEWRRSRRR